MIISGNKDPAARDSVLHIVQGQPELMVGTSRAKEDPPPYVRDQAQPQSRPVGFPRSQTLPALPPRSPVRPPLPASTTTLSQFGNGSINSTNHLYIKTRHDLIDGVFHIDPEVDAVALAKGGLTAHERREYNQSHRQKHRHHGRRGFWKRAEAPEPNAIFETRQGAISLDLYLVAGPHPLNSRALVQAATKHGSVNINVHGIHARRNLNLEVSTRHGDVHILIPRSFAGYIQLYSRRGKRAFLPSLANDTQLVYLRERETQVAIGAPAHGLPLKDSGWSGDTIHVSSRHGDILVGYLGEDTFPVPEQGFWKKLTDFFQT